MIRTTLLALFAMVLLGAGGCSPYALQGRVVSGDVSIAMIVDADDPRLDGDGVPSVSLRLESDPGQLRGKVIGTAVSGADGEIAIPVGEVGAGFLEYDVGVVARRPGYLTARGFFRLPPDRRRLLVIMTPGRDPEAEREPEDLMELYERYR